MDEAYCRSEILDRAYTYWRITGLRVDVEGIRRYQQDEGGEPCFGRVDPYCDREDCRWRYMCMQLRDTPQVGETLWLTLQTDWEA